MEKLRVKTFYTIFFIISIFILSAVLIFNIQSYQKEYDGIKNNLNRMNEIINVSKKPNNKKIDDKEPSHNDLDNKIIMDYNFYTFLLDNNNNIIAQISHNENILTDEIISKANKILSSSTTDKVKISSLYFSKISYSLTLGKSLIIVDTSIIQKRLLSLLLISIILVIIFEGLIYYFSKIITEWITKPVEDSFNKQKEFIANASHELKTPLAVIMANIDCLESNKKNEKWVNNLKSESDRMNSLITRLLELSRSENILDKQNYTLNNLSKIIEKRTLIFESLAFENKVRIESNIEKDIMFKCNQNDMDELISIIIDNAIKHSHIDNIINVNLYREKNNIILDIINKGDEIPKEECDMIFERFYRSDKSRNRASNRYGLGLAIAKNIVINHNGDIKAFSKEGYTTFRIILKNK